jgi:hypothetical protein
MAARLVSSTDLFGRRRQKAFPIISLFAMGDSQDEHGFLRGIDPIDNMIIAGTESMQALQWPKQLFDVWMMQWIDFQRLEA